MYLSYEVIVFNISRMKTISILRTTSVFAHISISDQIKGDSENDLKNLYMCVFVWMKYIIDSHEVYFSFYCLSQRLKKIK